MKIKILLTCEHITNRVPSRYKNLFKGKENILKTHQGWDIGARFIFNKLKNSLK